MRITGGQWRGLILTAPPGRDTRPTSDRVRESVFNILNHAAWAGPSWLENAPVLDVFAGTGALGLEALSHGAGHAAFMEQDRDAAAACRKNIHNLKADAQALLLTCDALHPPPRPTALAPRALVFLDPPYGRSLGAQALAALVQKDWLAPGAVCVLEMAKKQPEENPPGFILRDERKYGIALVRFLERAG